MRVLVKVEAKNTSSPQKVVVLFDVKPEDSVYSLQKKLETTVEIPADRQRLCLANISLSPHQTLSYYGLLNDADVPLSLTELALISLKVFPGDFQITCDFSPPIRILDLKEKLSQQLSIPAYCLELRNTLIAEQPLNDSNVLRPNHLNRFEFYLTTRENPRQISVRTGFVSGRIFNLSLNDLDLIDVLKEKYLTALGFKENEPQFRKISSWLNIKLNGFQLSEHEPRPISQLWEPSSFFVVSLNSAFGFDIPAQILMPNSVAQISYILRSCLASDTVGELKHRLAQDIKGLCSHPSFLLIELISNASKTACLSLDDNSWTLFEYGISGFENVQLKVRNSLSLQLRHHNLGDVVLWLDRFESEYSSLTVADVKKCIGKTYGLSTSDQILAFRGFEMDDDELLAKYSSLEDLIFGTFEAGILRRRRMQTEPLVVNFAVRDFGEFAVDPSDFNGESLRDVLTGHCPETLAGYDCWFNNHLVTSQHQVLPFKTNECLNEVALKPKKDDFISGKMLNVKLQGFSVSVPFNENLTADELCQIVGAKTGLVADKLRLCQKNIPLEGHLPIGRYKITPDEEFLYARYRPDGWKTF